jgi:hypothetical protein
MLPAGPTVSFTNPHRRSTTITYFHVGWKTAPIQNGGSVAWVIIMALHAALFDSQYLKS